MRKRWLNIFMGIFVLFFAGLWIAGCTEEIGMEGMKDKHNPDSADETEVVAIAGGGFNFFSPLDEESSHSIALKSDGTVWTWGDNSAGQLGDGTMTDSTTPIQVKALTDVVAVAAGSVHSIALKSDGTVWTWGNNKFGQLGVITTEECEFGFLNRICSTTPVQVPGFTDVIAITGGGFHTVALKSDGTVWSTSPVWSPTAVEFVGLTDVTAIAAGGYHTIALKTDGTVWAWGWNQYGQLGDGTTANSSTPVQVSGLTDVTAIAAGGNNFFVGHSIALKSDGTVWAWGDNSAGQLGVTTTEICEIYFGKEGAASTPCSTTSVQVSDLTDVTAVAAGWLYTLALKNDGTVWTWGSNIYGQLGATTTETCDGYAGSFDCSPTPVPVRSKLSGTFSVNGTVSGLAGTLIIQNNGGDDLIITEDGPFTFATELEDLDVYDIEILTQPNGQTCEFTGTNSGRINASDTDVSDIQINCLDFLADVVDITTGFFHKVALKTTTRYQHGDRVGHLGVGTTINSYFTPVQVIAA